MLEGKRRRNKERGKTAKRSYRLTCPKGLKRSGWDPPGGPRGSREAQKAGAPEEPRKAGKEEPGEQRRATRGRKEVGATIFSDFLPPEERREEKNKRNEPKNAWIAGSVHKINLANVGDFRHFYFRAKAGSKNKQRDGKIDERVEKESKNP